jgi:hypothetical protein
MKNILIFSNPFGYGPSGKALSIAKYIYNHSRGVNIYLCGGPHFKSIAGNDYEYIDLDERNEQDISRVINEIVGEKFIIASQNRFAIKAAKANNIPCAFLDGLAWFWKDIPKDHYLADIIFWLNYPNIKTRIPTAYRKKIFIIHGLGDHASRPTFKNKKGDVIFYIGGCNNTLAPLPENYLDLVSSLFELFFKNNNKEIIIACDAISAAYYRKKTNQFFKHVRVYDHEDFINKLESSSNFITNGGQTAVIEALSVKTPTSFFLPINLSQAALIKNIRDIEGYQDIICWEKYIELPEDFYQYNEKEAIIFLNQKAHLILNNKLLFAKLFDDFRLLILKEKSFAGNSYLSSVGKTGAMDMYKILAKKWKI